jgi:hypothetical protein
MKKKILKIAALVLALALIVGVCVFANSLVGNPISEMLATKTAEKYLAEKHPGKDYVLEGVTFNFKFICYNAYFKSPSSPDSSFTLCWEWTERSYTIITKTMFSSAGTRPDD